MIVIGLTGSIATGKSTVAKLLRAPPYNLDVIDADQISRDVVLPGTPAYREILSRFQDEVPDLILSDSRAINRPALGRAIFGHSPQQQAARKDLNSIVHPRVRRALFSHVMKSYLAGARALVMEVPLLLEAGWAPLFGSVIVVAVSDPELQVARLSLRDRSTLAEAQQRMASQMDVRSKARWADQRRRDIGSASAAVLWNDDDRPALEEQLAVAMADVLGPHPTWWSRLLLALPPLALAMGLFSVARAYYWSRRHPVAEFKTETSVS